MSIIIPHRFLSRLLPEENVSFINTVVIGTFNPGHPNLLRLTESEKQLFGKISTSKKFLKFCQVKNFYDRPQNRFWKIMDIISNPEFYSEKSLKTRNPNGIKYYAKMDRMKIFENQNSFCAQHGLMITDIVRQIEPTTFNSIYDNFPDKIIENSKCAWNTQGILNLIEKYQPKRIIVNFSLSKAIPKISMEIRKIQTAYKGKVFYVLSTSGAAGNSYEILLNNWKPYIS